MIRPKKSFIIAFIGTLNWACLNVWYYNWFYGTHDPICKGYFYGLLIMFNLFILYQNRLNKHKSWLSDQLLVICELSNIINFMILCISYFHIFGNIRNYFFTFNGSIFMLTLMILISGGRHDFFKENE